MSHFRKRFRLLLAIACVALAADAWSLEPPQLRTYVTDFAGVLTQSERDGIEQMLREYDARTSSQFVVLILTTLKGESLEDFSMRVAELNQIGRKGKDNGLLLLIALQDRKLRFEVGYGLEGVLTDALTSVIIRDVIAPSFREGRFAEGITAGLQAAMQAAAGEFTAPPSRERSKDDDGNIVPFIILLIIFFVFFRKKGRGRGGFIFIPGGFGGGFGGGGGGGFGGFSGGGGGFGGGGSSGSW